MPLYFETLNLCKDVKIIRKRLNLFFLSANKQTFDKSQYVLSRGTDMIISTVTHTC